MSADRFCCIEAWPLKQNDLSDLPLKPPAEAPPPRQRPTPAPPWVALLTAWLGLLTLIASIIVPFLPGTRSPREELEGLEPYSAADWFLLMPIYAAPVVFFLGIVVLWQMRKEPRPLPEAMVAQRVQAWVGMALAMIGVIFLYVFVWLRGPGAV